MTLELLDQEVDFILRVLAELPTKSNAYIVYQKIQQQVDEHVKKSNPEPV